MAIAEKTTFLLNNEYKEQVDMLNDVQAGQLFRAILQYANENTTDNIADPVVGMVFSFVRQQMDKDFKKYEETCKKRAEVGKKGGRPRKNIEEHVGIDDLDCPQDNEKPIGFLENQTKAKKAECDCDCESDCECDVLDLEQQQRQEDEEDVCAREAMPVDNSFFLFGKNQLPTTDEELEQAQALAEKLFGYYHHRQASQADVERVFEAVYRPAYTADDEAFAAFDQTRADLLEFAFRQAALQDQVKWSYIDTILDKYRKNDIETVEQAEEYEYMRNRGEVL